MTWILRKLIEIYQCLNVCSLFVNLFTSGGTKMLESDGQLIFNQFEIKSNQK